MIIQIEHIDCAHIAQYPCGQVIIADLGSNANPLLIYLKRLGALALRIKRGPHAIQSLSDLPLVPQPLRDQLTQSEYPHHFRWRDTASYPITFTCDRSG